MLNYAFISGCSLTFPPKANRYYFPEYYRGWICIQYNIENARPLPIEDGFLVHKIPENGLLVQQLVNSSPSCPGIFFKIKALTFAENSVR